MPWWQRLAYRTLEHPRLLAGFTVAGGLAQRAGLVPRATAAANELAALASSGGGPRWRRPEPTCGSSPVASWTAQAQPAHADTMAVLVGHWVSASPFPGPAAACRVAPCTAMPACTIGPAALARRVMGVLPASAPVLVDSAGCGAALKEYGRLVGTDAAAEFAARVFDVQEWMSNT